MKNEQLNILKEIEINKKTKTKTKIKEDELKEEIKKSQQKLNELKNITNPKLLEQIREVEKEINRLEILTINNENSRELLKQITTKESQEGEKVNQEEKSLIKGQISNEERLIMLKNVTTKNYTENKSNLINNEGEKLSTSNIKPKITSEQFSYSNYITTLEEKTSPNVMETQIYPLLNLYLSAKSSLLTKIIQLNPEKRHNNSLLIPHQRVMLKEHLDVTRRIIDDLDKKSEEIENELDKDFVVVKNKWEESERELIRLAQL